MAQTSQAQDRRTWWMAIPLAAAVVAAFAPVLDNGFVESWDDGQNFLDNPSFRGLGTAQVRWAWTTFLLGVYQPLAWMLLEAQYAAWGLWPRGYHLTSLMLHVLNTIALYAVTLALLRRCRPDSGPDAGRDDPWACPVGAALATTLFAVHPVRVEVVAWASCQPYLPCAGFSLMAVLAYVRAHPAAAPPRRGWLIGAFFLFAAALLCKPAVLGLPLVLLILDVCPLRRLGGGPGRWFGPSARPVWWEKGPFVALSVLVAGIAVVARFQAPHRALLKTWDLSARIAQAGYGIWFYVVKTVLPWDLTAHYPLPERVEWSAPPFVLSFLGTLGVTAGLFLLRRRRPGLLAAWLSYLVILAPSLGIVRIGNQAAADRYTYLATMGLVMPVAAGFGRLLAGGRRARPWAWGLGLAGLGAIGGLVLLTRGQCRTWRTAEVLWTHALSHGARHSDEAHNNLGTVRVKQGRLAEAGTEFAAAVRLNPGNAEAHFNLGLLLSMQGKTEASIAQYAAAVRLDPTDADALFNLGVSLEKQGKLAEARSHLLAALRLNPADAEARDHLGIILIGQGRLPEAMHQFAEAVRLNPGNAEAHINLGTGLSRQGKFSEAATHFREALRLKPGDQVARQGLADALQDQGRDAPHP
jgi:Flp pilus assembly protein TadD